VSGAGKRMLGDAVTILHICHSISRLLDRHVIPH
jgi:hypothetical protein